jgi:hypothetical protein
MRSVYFVTEGTTDQIVLEALVTAWLGTEDYLPRHIQPPSSAYAEGLDSNLSTGWKGVLAWCAGERPAGEAGRDQALELADCLIVHMDADVADDPDFKNPPFDGSCPPATAACDWVRSRIQEKFGGEVPGKVVLCVPSRDLEAWVLTSLHPDVADENMPIECRLDPGTLLIQRAPYRLVRWKAGALKKDTTRYRQYRAAIIAGWRWCTGGAEPRCTQAARFERETRQVLISQS